MSSYVRETKHPTKDLYIRKYTKRAFYDRAWTPETIRARGHVVNGEGKLLSCPFNKIFNIDEDLSTSCESLVYRLEHHPEDIYVRQKYNGHLAILFHDGEEWINTTSGSFVHDFIEPDRKLIEQTISPAILNIVPKTWTIMFEIIADYDPHLLTEMHKREIGGEGAIVIGVNNRDKQVSVPPEIWTSALISSGVSNVYIPSSISAMASMTILDMADSPEDWLLRLLRMKNTEGVVLYDPHGDFYVKIKTEWFINNRYVYNFAKNSLRKVFIEHGSTPEAFDKMPEELFNRYNRCLNEFTVYRNMIVCHLIEATYDIQYLIEDQDTIGDEDLYLLGFYIKGQMGGQKEKEEFERQLRMDYWNTHKSGMLETFTEPMKE